MRENNFRISMFIIIIFFTGFVLFCNRNSDQKQKSTWLWAKIIKGIDGGAMVKTDQTGNIYVSGSFKGKVMFDSISIVNTSNKEQIFLTKYNSDGKVLWAKSSTGTGYNSGGFITTDQNGNIYMAGSSNGGTIKFDNIILDKEPGSLDFVFLVKYDSSGNVLWAQKGVSPACDVSYVASDAYGNVYVTGRFGYNYIQFGTYEFYNPDNSNSLDNIFLVKYDKEGKVLWAKFFGGEHNDYSSCIVIDKSGDLFLTGDFQSKTISFESIELTNNSSIEDRFDSYFEDGFLVKLNSDGEVMYGVCLGGKQQDSGRMLAINSSGDVYISGIFYSDSLTINSVTLSKDANRDNIFLVKINSKGKVLWAKSGGGNYSTSYGMCIDKSDYIYLAGSYSNEKAKFGSFILSKINKNAESPFLVKYNSNGIVEWCKQPKGDYIGSGYFLAIDNTDNIYMTGNIFTRNPIFFDEIYLPEGSMGRLIAKFY